MHQGRKNTATKARRNKKMKNGTITRLNKNNWGAWGHPGTGITFDEYEEKYIATLTPPYKPGAELPRYKRILCTTLQEAKKAVKEYVKSVEDAIKAYENGKANG